MQESGLHEAEEGILAQFSHVRVPRATRPIAPNTESAKRYAQFIELLIVNEANRFKDAGLELTRDLADRGEFGLMLLGMPGLEKCLRNCFLQVKGVELY